jgi:hypothetical protein
MKKHKKPTRNKQIKGIMSARRVVNPDPIASPVETKTFPVPPVVADEMPLSITVPD